MPIEPTPAGMIAFLNGRYLPYEQVTIAPWDFGFTMGVTVTEQLRTFAGELPLLELHLQRLQQGLKIVGLEERVDVGEIESAIKKLVATNRVHIAPGSDLAVGVCVTPGEAASAMPTGFEPHNQLTVLIYNRELPFSNWAQHYRAGIELTTVSQREIPDAAIPKQLKCRSRMHYYLAEQEATVRRPGSRALLLDLAGNVAEGSTASIAMVRGGAIIAPPYASVLPSVAFRFAETLLGSAKSELKIERRPFSVAELKTADEVLWFSTPMCLLPVSHIDGVTIGGRALSGSQPDEVDASKAGQGNATESAAAPSVFAQLLQLWSSAVGVDLAEQAIAAADQSD